MVVFVSWILFETRSWIDNTPVVEKVSHTFRDQGLNSSTFVDYTQVDWACAFTL